MFSSDASARVFAAAALVGILFLAVPAAAAPDERGAPPGIFEQLIVWALEMMNSSGVPLEHEGGHLDPNGGGGRPGSCTNPSGCDNPPPGSGGS